MNIVSGKINCNTLFLKLETYIYSSLLYEYRIKFESYERLDEIVIDRLLSIPLIIYVKNNTLPSNIEIDSIEQYIDNIIYVEDELTLLYLYLNMKKEKMINVEISCILIESNKDIKKVSPIKTLIFLDYFIKRNKEGNIVKAGGLDYNKIESIFLNIYQKNIKQLLKNGQKYFYQNALNLNLSIYKTPYIYPKNYKNLHYSIDEIDINNFHKDRIYVYNCPICSNTHHIIISEIKSKKVNIDKYIYYNKSTDRYEFICNHERSEYDGINVNFGIQKEKQEKETLDEDKKIKIFLYMFLHYYNKDGKIYSKNLLNFDKEGYEVSKYIQVIQNKLLA